MKKVSKILFSILLISFMIFSTTVFATDTSFSPSRLDVSNSKINTDGMFSLGSDITKVLLSFASIVSVIVIIILGIKYMIGSPEDKSEYKKSMMPYFIGAVITFTGTIIAQTIYNFANSFSKVNVYQ